MKWRLALRKGAKWAGVTLVAAVVAAYVATVWCSLALSVQDRTATGGRARNVGIGAGTIVFACSDDWWARGVRAPDFEWTAEGRDAAFSWWPESVVLNGSFAGGIPLWIPLVLFALPTALVWRADRRAQRLGKGSCQSCGYDRRGLAVGVNCPECGTVP